MSYSPPATFITGAILTAPQVQVLADDISDLDRRTSPSGDVVSTLETTVSSTFAAMATAGPVVDVPIGSTGKALVSLWCKQSVNTAGEVSLMGYSISGASSVAASDDLALTFTSPTANGDVRHGGTHLITGLNAGSTRFTALYRRTNGTASFGARRLAVTPLGS
jgi:hypothetical protein